MVNLHDLRQRIQVEAHRLGFDLFGVALPDPPARAETFLHWLEEGRHGEMGYLSEPRNLQKRLDPSLILDGCQSIIVVAMRYNPAELSPLSPPTPLSPRWGERGERAVIGDGSATSLKASGSEEGSSFPPSVLEKPVHPQEQDSSPITTSPPLSPPRGERGGRGDRGAARILTSSYASGLDYHDLIPLRLSQLAEFIERQLAHPIRWKAYTDTGPILERDLAQRAGLGWIGKNTLLIHPRLGSYFFLAELFLDLPLPPTPPFTADHCGACTRCLNACPTQCILPDRTIDARRCISYLTIENKGDIPEDLRPLIGAWAFGCDVCQQVCPWNVRFAAPTDEPHFAPRHAAGQADLAAELGLDAPAFNRKFKGRPQKRAKRRGYLRNLAVAAGNTGGPDIVPALQLAANDDEALVRRHAVWALEQIQRRTGLSGGADEMKDA